MEKNAPGLSDHTPAPSAVSPSAADLGLPGLDDLLALAGEGDQASFSAFYDATAPWVYGMASALFAAESDAAEATVLTFLRAWDEAPYERFDEDSARVRHRSVLCWLEVLAHGTMTRLLREDALPGFGEGLLPENAGASEGGRREPTTVLSILTPAQFEALDLAWAGGRTYRQVAEELGVAVPTVKSRLRDAVQRISARYQEKFLGRSGSEDPVLQRAVTPEIAARTGTTRNFTLNLSQDLENGLGKEWADLVALDAVTGSEREELDRFLARQGPEFTTLWRARIEAARRTVTWAFRGLATEPPSELLDEVLHRLPAQDVGMGLVDGLGPSDEHAGGESSRRPVKKWMLVVAGLLVLALGLWTVVRLIMGPNIVAAVNRAEDSFTTQQVSLAEGGSMQGHVSKDAGMAYVTFAGLPVPDEGAVFQLWLFPTDGSAPHSLGTYTPEDLQDPVTFRGVERFRELVVTLEPEGGSETPTTASLGSVDLVHQVTQGPIYGGHPNNTPTPSSGG
ncbi:anti-sigma factor domain-containing protein [Citricoccus sp. I39-566]|uniref:anti-sigma factor n=1 Tax=Citricoccus sp. I39-566 TaxID=3073268 RepID=UPI00286A0FD8|nr:anti-sigma factor [Citricoccus sp. I39-566]WMY77746.1 anti-sigma factor [Citricoccus sp. I39-566]